MNRSTNHVQCIKTSLYKQDSARIELTVDLLHMSALETISRCVKYKDEDADQTLALSQAVITIAVAR
jgi:hypothetical protein